MLERIWQQAGTGAVPVLTYFLGDTGSSSKATRGEL